MRFHVAVAMFENQVMNVKFPMDFEKLKLEEMFHIGLLAFAMRCCSLRRDRILLMYSFFDLRIFSNVFC